MGNFYHGVANCSHRKFCSEFFTQISEHFVHISGCILPITLGIIVLQNLSIRSKVMMSEVEKGHGWLRPTQVSMG